MSAPAEECRSSEELLHLRLREEKLMSNAKRVLEQAIELWNAIAREGWALYTPMTLSTRHPVKRVFQGWQT
jgi:hypothetical protein